MFPPSLHKNIRELDKQITLLESECENMESEKRKKSITNKISVPRGKDSVIHAKKPKDDGERPFITGPRVPEVALAKKSSKSATKVSQKSSVSGIKKMSSNRDTPTVVSDYEYGKKHGRNCPICGSERQSGSKRDRKSQGVTSCVCGRELVNDFGKCVDFYETDEKVNDSENEKQVLHKGILHANPGGTIEVTVTQKPNKTPSNGAKGFSNRNSAILLKNVRKSEGDSFVSKESAKVNKTPKDQKWCEILRQENASDKRIRGSTLKNNEVKSNYSLNSKFMNQYEAEPRKYNSVGDTHVKVPNSRFSKCEKELLSELWNDENECPDSPVSSAPREIRQNSPLKRKNLENVIDASPRTGRSYEEKEVQCGSDEAEKSYLSEESFDPLRTLYSVIDTLKGSFNEEEVKRLLSELELCLQKLNQEPQDVKKVEDKADDCDAYNKHYVKKLKKHFWITKKLCEKLLKEKNKLSEDLAVKERLLSNLMNKEKEYLTTITNLKVSLEKKKVQAEDNIEILKELNSVKNKLLNETKVADALRKSHAKMQEQVQKCMLENDKLKTEIRLNKLESQKFCVLLAGKDAEIKRYKDEVESFQRQITEQLAALRSNNAANEVQKAMEAIIQHSQVLSVTDLDSAFSETHTDDRAARTGSRQRDKLMHSSPTSTKSSVLDSSWNHISSIHEDDTGSWNAFGSEVLVGDLPRAAPEEEESEVKKAHSFVSCRSAEDATANELSRLQERDGTELENVSSSKTGDGVASILENNKLRRNIEELFEDLKTKCSHRIFSISSDKVNFDDVFNSSETSDLSEVSGSYFGVDDKGNKP